MIDTSALLAIFLREPEAERFALAIEADVEPLLSAANLLEAAIVMRAKRQPTLAEAEPWLDALLERAGVAVEPVTLDQIRIARLAHARYGKGSGHPAHLNFGDCFAYALACARGAPLLFKGDDFTHTDVQRAEP